MLSFLCVSYSYDGRRSGCGHVGMCRRERMRQGERVSGMCKASEKSLFLAYIPLRAFLIAALTSSKYVLDENQC